MDAELYKIKKERESIPKEVQEYIRLERDRIFNEGVEAGKKFIFMLNNGEMSMEDFNNKNFRYEQKRDC